LQWGTSRRGKGMQQKVLILSYHFPPDPSVGGQRIFRFYKYLSRFGYEPIVVAACADQPPPMPNVHYIRDRSARFWQDPNAAAAGLPFATQVERVARLLVLPGQVGLEWSLSAGDLCAELIRQHKPAALISSYPPLAVSIAAERALRQADCPWIADLRDPMSVLGATQWLGRLLSERFEKRMQQASAVIANCDTALADILSRRPSLQPKAFAIWNGFDPDQVQSALPVDDHGKRRIVHSGSLYDGRNPNLVLRSLQRLRNRGLALDVVVELVGDVSASSGVDAALVDIGVQQGWIVTTGPLPKAEADRRSRSAHGLLLLQPQTTVSVPAKLFDYVRIGRPVLAIMAPGSPIEDLLVRAGLAHLSVYPNDREDVIDTKIEQFLQLDSTARPLSEDFQRDFNAVNQAGMLASIIRRIQASGPNEPLGT